MKKITNKTLLKQEGKTFNPVEVEDVIYWVDNKPIEIGDKFVDKYSPWSLRERIKTETDIRGTIASELYTHSLMNCFIPVAQTKSKFTAVLPVINLDSYIDNITYNHFKDYWKKEDGSELKGEEISTDMMTNYLSEVFSFIGGYKANPNQYTQKDIEKAIELAITLVDGKHEFDIENILGSSDGTYGIKQKYTQKEIIEQINSVSIIEVDEKFNILNF